MVFDRVPPQKDGIAELHALRLSFFVNNVIKQIKVRVTTVGLLTTGTTLLQQVSSVFSVDVELRFNHVSFLFH